MLFRFESNDSPSPRPDATRSLHLRGPSPKRGWCQDTPSLPSLRSFWAAAPVVGQGIHLDPGSHPGILVFLGVTVVHTHRRAQQLQAQLFLASTHFQLTQRVCAVNLVPWSLLAAPPLYLALLRGGCHSIPCPTAFPALQHSLTCHSGTAAASRALHGIYPWGNHRAVNGISIRCHCGD